MKNDQFAEEITATINLSSLPQIPEKSCKKTFPLTFSMVHLLHRLYGVDAPAWKKDLDKEMWTTDFNYSWRKMEGR